MPAHLCVPGVSTYLNIQGFVLCGYFLHAKACLKLIPSRKGRESKIVTVSTKRGYLSTERQSMSHSKKDLVTSLFF